MYITYILHILYIYFGLNTVKDTFVLQKLLVSVALHT